MTFLSTSTNTSSIGTGVGVATGTKMPSITTIEWHMLDKKRWVPLSMMSSFTVRCFLYPLTLIRTRLQVSSHHSLGLYILTRHLLRSSTRMLCIRGLLTHTDRFLGLKDTGVSTGVFGFLLFRYFMFQQIFLLLNLSLQVVSGVAYVSTYEGVRHMLDMNGMKDLRVKALVGGSCASIVGQTVIVPFDVISQHLMVLGISPRASQGGDMTANPLAINTEGRSKFQISCDITRTIYQRDGLKGFYRGYVAALCNYVPSSASWWTFYSVYQEVGSSTAPDWAPHTAVQCTAAVLAGCTTSLITNPLDLIRTRVQVQRKTIPDTIRVLWEAERFNIFKKGLTARMSSSCIYSLAVIFGYETVKKMSVLPQYKSSVAW